MAGFTVVVAGMIRGTLTPVIDAVTVPDTANAAEAGRRAAAFEAATGIAVIPAETIPWPIEPDALAEKHAGVSARSCPRTWCKSG